MESETLIGLYENMVEDRSKYHIMRFRLVNGSIADTRYVGKTTLDNGLESAGSSLGQSELVSGFEIDAKLTDSLIDTIVNRYKSLNLHREALAYTDRSTQTSWVLLFKVI